MASASSGEGPVRIFDVNGPENEWGKQVNILS